MMEEKLIGELQKTLQRKNQAVDNLQSKSPALKKGFEPRQAYKYKTKEGGEVEGYRTQDGFNKSGARLQAEQNRTPDVDE